MTRQLARRLRAEATRPERDAWELLRHLRDDGIAIRRQHPIGRYIADFAIMRARVAIEIDGPLHEAPERKLADAERDAAFALLGWKTLRFTPAQVADADTFLAAIRSANPSPRGEGAGGGVKHRVSRTNDDASAYGNFSSEHHPTPQPPPLAGRGSDAALPPHLQRRTRANRKLPTRAKP